MTDPNHNRKVAARIIDQVLADVMDRRGFESEWELTANNVKTEIRETLIGIATAELNESCQTPED